MSLKSLLPALLLCLAASGAWATAPNAPSNLVCTTLGHTSVTLTWTDNATDEEGFRVDYQTYNGSAWSAWQALAYVGASSTGSASYTRTNLTAKTIYQFRVLAYNGGGMVASGFSNTRWGATMYAPVAHGINPETGAAMSTDPNYNPTRDYAYMLMDEAARYYLRTGPLPNIGNFAYTLIANRHVDNESYKQMYAVNYLCMAFNLLDKANTDAGSALLNGIHATDISRMLDLLKVQGYDVMYPIWTSSQRKYSGRFIRQMYAFTNVGLILTHELASTDSRYTPGATMRNDGLRGIKIAFDCCDPSWSANKWEGSFAHDGVYAEGFEYCSVMSEGLASLMYIYNQYPPAVARIDGASGEWFKPVVAAANESPRVLDNFLWWIAVAERPDGFWPRDNDSNTGDFDVLPVYIKLSAGNTMLYDALRWAYRQASPAKTGRPVVEFKFGDNVLAALFTVTAYPYDTPPNGMTIGQFLYPYGGQLILGSCGNFSGAQKNERIWGFFANEGSWIKTDHTFPESTAATYTLDDYLYTKQDDYLFHSFITPGDKISDSPQVGHYAPKRHSHKHFNDTHFELFAYGKPLLIGPGKPGYVQDVGYKGGVFNGTTYPDQFFFNRHDYEAAGMTIPASGVSNDEVEVNASYPALFGHAEWEAPDYRPAYGVAPFHGTPYINFTHPTMYNLLAVGPGNGYYPKTPVREVDNPPVNAADLFGEAKVEFKGASATRAAALYKMHADSYDRYVLFARDRYYVIFDRINNTMWNNTAQHLRLRLHGQGTLALSTYPNSQSISYPLGTWTWKQDPTFADAAHTLTASNIHLLAYPAFADTTRLTCTVDHEGRDPGVSDWDLNGSYRHNLYKHDVYDIQTVNDQRSMAVLLWPKNDQLSAVNPTVNWVDGNGYYTLTVSYNAEGQNFSDTWTFPVNTTLEHINNLLGLTPPSVPAVIAAGALTAASPSKGRIDLNWTYSGTADWFEITRSETGATGSWGTPRRVAGADRAFYDTNLDYGKTYYYKVRPINSRGWASWTSTVSATTLSS